MPIMPNILPTVNKPIEEKVELFLDRGLRYYLQRVFWNDFNIKRELDAVGYLSESELYSKEAKDLPDIALDNNAGSLGSPYNALAKRLNDFKRRPEHQLPETWKKLLSDIKSYFKKNVKIYEYMGPKMCSHEGYYLDSENGKLMYYVPQKKLLIEISDFPLNNLEIKTKFSQIIKTKSIVGNLTTGQRSLRLNSDLFISMINHAQNSSPGKDLKFSLPPQNKFIVHADFMNTFGVLTKYQESKTLQKKFSIGYESRSRVELVKDLINKINFKVQKYLDENVTNRYMLDSKYTSMEAIKQYLIDGDVDAFARKVGQDSFFKRIRKIFSKSDEVDRTMRIVKSMMSSKFFQIALSEIKEEKKARIRENQLEKEKIDLEKKEADNIKKLDNQRFHFAYAVKNSGDFKNFINDTWASYKITREVCLDTLNKLLTKLNQTSIEKLTEVQIPAHLLQMKNLNISSSGTVVDYLNGVIENSKRSVESLDSETLEFSKLLADIQGKILDVLTYEYKTDDDNRLIKSKELKEYYKLGDELFNILKATEKEPAKEEKVMISVPKVEQEIIRLQKVYKEYLTKIRTWSSEFLDLQQLDVRSSIDNYINTKFTEFENKLTEYLMDVRKVQDKAPFNKLKPVSPSQHKVVNIINDLKNDETSIFDNVTRILMFEVEVDENGNFQNDTDKMRAYDSPFLESEENKDIVEGDKLKFSTLFSNIRDGVLEIHREQPKFIEEYVVVSEKSLTTILNVSNFSIYKPNVDNKKSGLPSLEKDKGSESGYESDSSLNP